ncbi:MAG: preQ(1) synthase [Acidimicrobiia bacterium]|nr:preQ(1) synthase [Acidimicrobiia bacterium]
MPTTPSKDLLAVDNPHPGRDYEVRCETPRRADLPPSDGAGQPRLRHRRAAAYVPGASILELKSLKTYLWSFRDEGAFHEDVTNRILDDLVAAIDPRRMTVRTRWNVRGGITTDVTASHP